MAKSMKTSAILAVIAGILVLAFPNFLAWAVGLYLIITGALDLFSVNKIETINLSSNL